MNNYILYANGASGNHGCEAITRALIKILDAKGCKIFSQNIAEDEKYGISAATLDGYLGFYSQQYKEDFRKIIAPALERVEATRIYYDDWGARAYLYSGTDLSIVSATKTVYATDDHIYMDGEAFAALGGEYLFSRIKLSNAAEAGLSLLGEYTAADGSMTVYAYKH